MRANDLKTKRLFMICFSYSLLFGTRGYVAFAAYEDLLQNVKLFLYHLTFFFCNLSALIPSCSGGSG